ncbi:MAG TPA: tail fiber domain-containing protein [Longimicrobium sp.]|nr:tail fiber domain-containing protein [Longimicrobium sp.]
MKLLLSTLALAVSLAASLHTPAAAQSDILLRLRSGSPLGDRFRVDSASGFVAKGVLGIGIIPFTGAGERMMWHPYKAAFRAGSIGSAGTQWDDPNVGFYTWAGGYNTIALGLSSFAMGYQSTALGSYSTALGYTANADGTGAVALGYRTTANADYSVAIGQRASTSGRAGAIVFSDGSTTDSTRASANNQFTVRAAGGTRLFTNATMTTGVQLSAGGSSWSVISDRNRKEAFLGIDGEDVLTRIRSLPVTTWRYIDEEDRTVRHIGPMAQDWHRAFGFTSDATTINMSDFDGVNLAAIQALEARTTGQAARIETLEAENDALRARVGERDRAVESLEARVARLEALMADAAARP